MGFRGLGFRFYLVLISHVEQPHDIHVRLLDAVRHRHVDELGHAQLAQSDEAGQAELRPHFEQGYHLVHVFHLWNLACACVCMCVCCVVCVHAVGCVCGGGELFSVSVLM